MAIRAGLTVGQLLLYSMEITADFLNTRLCAMQCLTLFCCRSETCEMRSSKWAADSGEFLAEAVLLLSQSSVLQVLHLEKTGLRLPYLSALTHGEKR